MASTVFVRVLLTRDNAFVLSVFFSDAFSVNRLCNAILTFCCIFKAAYTWACEPGGGGGGGGGVTTAAAAFVICSVCMGTITLRFGSVMLLLLLLLPRPFLQLKQLASLPTAPLVSRDPCIVARTMT
jgi:hypothetical protein